MHGSEGGARSGDRRIGGSQEREREYAETRNLENRRPTIQTRKLSYNEQRELEALPARIEALEREQQALREEMEGAGFYKAGAERIKQVMSRIEDAAREHDQLLARWVELEERS